MIRSAFEWRPILRIGAYSLAFGALLPFFGRLGRTAHRVLQLALDAVQERRLVYGFSNAASHPLMPLRILLERDRGGILGPLLIIGIGIGLVMAPAMNIATFGVNADDAGVASALVNTMQQVGGSIGTALLDTLATAAATSYLAGKQPNPLVLVHAQLHSYITAFWWSAGFFAAGAIICGLLLRPGAHVTDSGSAPAIHG